MTGWARAKRGTPREGLALIREGLAGIGGSVLDWGSLLSSRFWPKPKLSTGRSPKPSEQSRTRST